MAGSRTSQSHFRQQHQGCHARAPPKTTSIQSNKSSLGRGGHQTLLAAGAARAFLATLLVSAWQPAPGDKTGRTQQRETHGDAFGTQTVRAYANSAPRVPNHCQKHRALRTLRGQFGNTSWRLAVASRSPNRCSKLRTTSLAISLQTSTVLRSKVCQRPTDPDGTKPTCSSLLPKMLWLSALRSQRRLSK